MKKWILSNLFIGVVFCTFLSSQSRIFPLNHSISNKVSQNIYKIDSNIHTSIQPYNTKDIGVGDILDSLYYIRNIPQYNSSTWIGKKIFNEHLFDYFDNDFRIYGDFYPDINIGIDLNDNRINYLNTRGFQLAGSVGTEFSFSSEVYENQAEFPSYLKKNVLAKSVIPGQGFPKLIGSNGFDYSYSSAIILYQTSKYLNIQGGHGKNFFGDGYRSLLLSDVSFNYPYLKLTADIWEIKYVMLWAEFQNITSQKVDNRFTWKKKSGVFHYLDIKLTKRLTLGLFEGIIWLPQDSIINRGIEWNYLNPIIFFRPVEFSLSSPDNILMGLNTSYQITDKTVAYGQFLIDEMSINEFISKKGYWGNKYGVQFGVKSYYSFGIQNLYIQGELNIVSPYTYSHRDPLKNYGHYNQSLAHPLGANFYELIFVSSYSYERFDFNLQLNYARYGVDSTSQDNNGSDIFKSYATRISDYGNYIGQGGKVNLFYSNAMLAYILNPLTNLRIEFSITNRSLTSDINPSRTMWLNVGIRGSFRNFYYDY